MKALNFLTTLKSAQILSAVIFIFILSPIFGQYHVNNKLTKIYSLPFQQNIEITVVTGEVFTITRNFNGLGGKPELTSRYNEVAVLDIPGFFVSTSGGFNLPSSGSNGILYKFNFNENNTTINPTTYYTKYSSSQGMPAGELAYSTYDTYLKSDGTFFKSFVISTDFGLGASEPFYYPSIAGFFTEPFKDFLDLFGADYTCHGENNTTCSTNEVSTINRNGFFQLTDNVMMEGDLQMVEGNFTCGLKLIKSDGEVNCAVDSNGDLLDVYIEYYGMHYNKSLFRINDLESFFGDHYYNEITDEYITDLSVLWGDDYSEKIQLFAQHGHQNNFGYTFNNSNGNLLNLESFEVTEAEILLNGNWVEPFVINESIYYIQQNQINKFSFYKKETFQSETEYLAEFSPPIESTGIVNSSIGAVVPSGPDSLLITGYVTNLTDSIHRSLWLIKTDLNGCWNADCAPLNVNNIERLEPSFTLYPNPASDQINIAFESLPQEEILHLNVYDILGKPLLSKQITDLNMQLDVGQWQKGIYIAEVIGLNTKKVKRFLVQ
jgi:hypothetical protein